MTVGFSFQSFGATKRKKNSAIFEFQITEFYLHVHHYGKNIRVF